MEIHTYLIKVQVTTYKILLITSFSVPDAQDVLKEFYHRRLNSLQRNINNYKVIPMGKFNPESEFFKLACDGIEYIETYS